MFEARFVPFDYLLSLKMPYHPVYLGRTDATYFRHPGYAQIVGHFLRALIDHVQYVASDDSRVDVESARYLQIEVHPLCLFIV